MTVMTNTAITRSFGGLLLALLILTVKYIDGQDNFTTECTTGAGCFEDGQLPLDLTSKDTAYYCCLQRNMTERSSRLPDGTFNCSCVLDLSLPAKVINWARRTRNDGRMCTRKRCEGTGVTSTISERFHYCCRDAGHNDTRSEVTFIDADKEEFIGCRCHHLPVPSPDPRAYIVPEVMMEEEEEEEGGVQAFNSTGESCSYDAACQDDPALKCVSSDVTFCCYGSRGMRLRNDRDSGLTLCTCADEIYGAQCEANPVAIADTTLPCETECGNRTEADVCTNERGSQRCCPHNMAVVASQSGGVFTSCVCQAQPLRADNCGSQTSGGGGLPSTTPSSLASQNSLHCGGGCLSRVMLLLMVVLLPVLAQ